MPSWLILTIDNDFQAMVMNFLNACIIILPPEVLMFKLVSFASFGSYISSKQTWLIVKLSNNKKVKTEWKVAVEQQFID